MYFCRTFYFIINNANTLWTRYQYDVINNMISSKRPFFFLVISHSMIIGFNLLKIVTMSRIQLNRSCENTTLSVSVWISSGLCLWRIMNSYGPSVCVLDYHCSCVYSSVCIQIVHSCMSIHVHMCDSIIYSALKATQWCVCMCALHIQPLQCIGPNVFILQRLFMFTHSNKLTDRQIL